jgi:hypothetical protein
VSLSEKDRDTCITPRRSRPHAFRVARRCTYPGGVARGVSYRHGGRPPRGGTLVAMIAIRVTRCGVEIALLRFFGYEVYDLQGWPRVREAPGETPGWAVDRGELPTEIIAGLLDAVLQSPVTGMVGENGYRIDEPQQPLPPRPIRRRRR